MPISAWHPRSLLLPLNYGDQTHRLNHPTLDKLQTLKLTGMTTALLEQMDSTEIESLAFEERLGLLVDRKSPTVTTAA